MRFRRDDQRDEWRSTLSPDVYRVTREGATEPPFSGELLREKRAGTYRCACCGQALFDARSKFDSGTGWPSFYEPAAASAVGEERDTTLGVARTEVHCSACRAHLGHVFPDGPQPTGLRYCINSLALAFESDVGE